MTQKLESEASFLLCIARMGLILSGNFSLYNWLGRAYLTGEVI